MVVQVMLSLFLISDNERTIYYFFSSVWLIRVMQITGFYQMLMLASQICGEQNVSSQPDAHTPPPLLFLFFYLSLALSLYLDSKYWIPWFLTIAGVEWNDLGTLHEDYAMANISIPQPQTPPSNATEGPPANSTRSWDLGKCILMNQIVDTRTFIWWEPMMSNHSHLFKNPGGWIEGPQEMPAGGSQKKCMELLDGRWR